MKKNIFINKIIAIINIMIILFSCSKNKMKNDENTLYVYNWGLYIDENVITKFEDEYNIKVVYDMFDTNEEMFAVINSGGRTYDVICPTDYMIEKMMKLNMLYDYDFNELENIKNVDEKMFSIMQSFDNENKYAIPYVHSTLGIIYNKTALDKKNLPYPKAWKDLFNPIYKNEILMQDAMRDLLMVGLKSNNFSMNTTDTNEINIATNDLINQKPLVNSYVIDQVRDKMVLGEGSVGVTYSGEVEYIKEQGKLNNYEYEYILPIEGVNFTIDAWVIPKNSKNKQLAKKWIDFMLREDIALMNFEYMHYGIANLKAMEKIDDKLLNDFSVFPNLDDIDKYEIYKDLSMIDKNTNMTYEEIYYEAYKKIKS